MAYKVLNNVQLKDATGVSSLIDRYACFSY